MVMQMHFAHEHSKNSTNWRKLEAQSLASDQQVYCIAVLVQRIVVVIFECHQTTDDLGWCDQSRGTALCRSRAR